MQVKHLLFKTLLFKPNCNISFLEMSQQNKRIKTNGLDESLPGPSNVSQLTPDARALARSEQVIIWKL